MTDSTISKVEDVYVRLITALGHDLTLLEPYEGYAILHIVATISTIMGGLGHTDREWETISLIANNVLDRPERDGRQLSFNESPYHFRICCAIHGVLDKVPEFDGCPACYLGGSFRKDVAYAYCSKHGMYEAQMSRCPGCSGERQRATVNPLGGQVAKDA